MIFGRVSTAMVTPFDSKGNVDFQKTTTLVNYLIANGTDSLVLAGTTGESPTLSSEEKVALLRHVVKVVEKRVPIIMGTGSNNTYASIEMTKKAEQNGADAIMLVAPYYSKTNQEGLYQHFKAIAESTSLPVMVYNIPGRASVNIEPETIIRLSEISNIVAVKEASGDLNAMTQIIAGTDDDFVLYSGDDALLLPVLAIGGAGVVSVASHVAGKELQQLIQEFFEGNLAQAAKLHQELLPLIKGLFSAPSPAPVKLPIVPLTEQERLNLSAVLKK